MTTTIMRHALIFVFYLGIAGLALYTLVFHFNTHVPGAFTTDYYHFHWSYWWIREALSSPALEIYRTNYVMAPAESNLALHTMAPAWFPVWAVVEPVFNTKAALTTIYLLGLSLTGYTFYLLARRFAVAVPFALVGGVLLTLSPGQMNAVYMSTVHYLCFFWLPLNLLLWQQVSLHVSHQWKAWLWTVLMALSLYGLIMTDLQGPIYSAFLLVPFGILTLVRAGSWSDRLKLAGHGIAANVLALVLLWIAGPLRYILTFNFDSLAPASLKGAFQIPFPEGFFSRLPEYWLTHSDLSYGYLIVPAFLLSAIVAVVLIRRRKTWHKADDRWFWFVVSIPPLLLSAGGTITLLGTEVAMPYQLLHEVFNGIFRQPARLSTVFFIPALIFVGLVFSDWLRTRSRTVYFLTAILLILVAADVRLYEPLPIQPGPPIYDFYHDMAHEEMDYVVLDVPTAAGSGEWGVGETAWLRTQYAAIAHHKRVSNGLIARVDPWHFLYMETSDPVMAWLGQRRYLEPDVVTAQLADMIHAWPVGYIIVHTDLIGQDKTAVQEIIGYFNRHPELVCPYAVEGAAIAYRTAWHPDGCDVRRPPRGDDSTYRIDVGARQDRPFLGWGWYYPEDVAGLDVRWLGDRRQLVAGQDEWADGSTHRATLYADLPVTDMTMRLSAQAFQEPRELTLTVNGTVIGKQTVAPNGLQTVTFQVPAAALDDGQHVAFTLQYDDAVSTGQAGLSGDARRLALMVDWIAFDLDA